MASYDPWEESLKRLSDCIREYKVEIKWIEREADKMQAVIRLSENRREVKRCTRYLSELMDYYNECIRLIPFKMPSQCLVCHKRWGMRYMGIGDDEHGLHHVIGCVNCQTNAHYSATLYLSK